MMDVSNMQLASGAAFAKMKSPDGDIIFVEIVAAAPDDPTIPKNFVFAFRSEVFDQFVALARDAAVSGAL